jgi:hypothetical protein
LIWFVYDCTPNIGKSQRSKWTEDGSPLLCGIHCRANLGPRIVSRAAGRGRRILPGFLENDLDLIAQVQASFLQCWLGDCALLELQKKRIQIAPTPSNCT